MSKSLTYVIVAICIFITLGLAGILLVVWWGAKPALVPPENLSAGIAIHQEELSAAQSELTKTIESAPNQVMKGFGIAGAMGGAHLKLSSSDPQEILLPIPQLADNQVPLCFFISCIPPDAATEFRLCRLEDSNDVVCVRLVGNDREVQLAWSSVVLFASQVALPNTIPAAPFRGESPCVQSQANEVTKLADTLFPAGDKSAEFATNIQRHIREMKRQKQPLSLDALGILQSGENGICTANANLAAALMRSKGIACRTIAVIPPNSQRLEMHRIVEFFDNDRWHPFDPSSVQIDIPEKAWQNVIISKTTVWDEEMAMKPRMGFALGCPFGQEIELISSGIHLSGQDFFWTTAKPLAEFEPTKEAVGVAVESWRSYLKTGRLTSGQIHAAFAKTAAEFAEKLRAE